MSRKICGTEDTVAVVFGKHNLPQKSIRKNKGNSLGGFVGGKSCGASPALSVGEKTLRVNCSLKIMGCWEEAEPGILHPAWVPIELLILDPSARDYVEH